MTWQGLPQWRDAAPHHAIGAITCAVPRNARDAATAARTAAAAICAARPACLGNVSMPTLRLF
eukprot:347489-Chlamydomonas_euryale.AAC.3